MTSLGSKSITHWRSDEVPENITMVRDIQGAMNCVGENAHQAGNCAGWCNPISNVLAKFYSREILHSLTVQITLASNRFLFEETVSD